jgi:arsenite methyltransferase
MKNAKEIVREKYGQIAVQSNTENDQSCCSGLCCSTIDYTDFSENYKEIEGYNPDADMGLGCGIPTEFAKIKKGDTIVDLGSGAGNDCFVARAITGETGHIIGIDMTEAMIAKARQNASKLGFKNVEFRLSDIESMNVDSGSADVVISNCVLNLVPDKERAFQEINRILKPGAHLSVSDVVLKGELPGEIRGAAEMYAGCVSGAIELEKYLKLMASAGLININIQKEKVITIPDETLLNYLDQKGLEKFRQSDTGIFSITVYAEKPSA